MSTEELGRRQREVEAEADGGQLYREFSVAAAEYPLVAATYRKLVYLAPTPSLPEVCPVERCNRRGPSKGELGRGKRVEVID